MTKDIQALIDLRKEEQKRHSNLHEEHLYKMADLQEKINIIRENCSHEYGEVHSITSIGGFLGRTCSLCGDITLLIDEGGKSINE